MKWCAFFFIVMVAASSVQPIALSVGGAEESVLSSNNGNAQLAQEESDNPLFKHKEQIGLSNGELGTLVFLGLGLMLVPVIRRSILAKLLV